MKRLPVSSLDPALIDPEIQGILAELGESAGWSAYEGAYHESLIAALSARFGRSQAQLCCSGTFAVELALRGCRIEAGDEVLLAAYDFPGNFRAIEAVGASVAIVDIPSDAWSFNGIEELDHAVGPSTKAIIVSHLHGTTASMSMICDWARRRKLRVIEDACQAPGAVIDGQPAGSWGDCSIFSFGGSKLLSAGRGGAVLTDDPRIGQRMRIYRERGNDAFAMSELQAAVLGPQLQKLEVQHARRAAAVSEIEKMAASFDWLACPFRNQTIDATAFYKWAFQVRSAKAPANAMRDTVVALLNEQEVLAGTGFHGFSRRSDARCRRVGPLTNARFAAQSTILIHHTMLNQSLSQHLFEVDRQLHEAKLIDPR